ncbi:hypothetical protein E2C01_016577 [Portunus trituberculatus]|uniref:Uncharacterized protein n=1 Tax=Portunus trituberculatus TaxID=210409 RepID=A0A5B7DRA0_PORTR|nr:hypothetical protein [Portunus trituberculatus]
MAALRCYEVMQLVWVLRGVARQVWRIDDVVGGIRVSRHNNYIKEEKVQYSAIIVCGGREHIPGSEDRGVVWRFWELVRGKIEMK